MRLIDADKLGNLIAGHSNYSGDRILAAIYCMAEGKEVGKITPLDEEKTNREKLANMSNKELADYLFSISGVCEMCDNSCYNYNCQRYICVNLNADCSEHIQKWLESEVE